jgi:hypothetical protein
LRPRKPNQAARRPCSAPGGLPRDFGVLDEEQEQRLEHGDLAGAEGGEDGEADGGDDSQREVAEVAGKLESKHMSEWNEATHESIVDRERRRVSHK